MSEHRSHESYEGMALGNNEKAGGTRYNRGKPNMCWAPWLGMVEVCRVSVFGAEKYAPLDWAEGQSYTTLLGSTMRHVMAIMADPLAVDPDSGRLHAGHAAWNLLCLLHFHEEGRSEDMDDVTGWRGVTAAQDNQDSTSSEHGGRR